ncbi:MAG: response regulator [Spirochaetia bacterium]|nr:response regulator [Spirochaetia bacterium]MDY4211388.1 response regulator [Treponema sp.]
MSYSVLIVEDDPMVSMINEQYVLKGADFTIAGTCRNGNEAIEFLKSHTTDLILLDVYMPVMDGIAVLKKIREMKIPSEVIMITAANDTTTIENTMHFGVLDYLIKPFAYERFNVALEKFKIKHQLLKGSSVLDQHSLDSLITANFQKEKKELNINLPKGIQRTTLNRIKIFFDQNQNWQSVDMISDALGISLVTARNYLNYLVSQKIVLEDINYSTGGRPSMLYKKNN